MRKWRFSCFTQVAGRPYAFRFSEPSEPGQAVIVVVVDTNVFVRETHLLRKKGGPALVRLLRATNGRLLIPEILHRECVEQSVKMANDGRSAVITALNTLDTLLGVRLENPFPGHEAVRSGAAARLRALEPLTIPDPLTPELYTAAGNRTIADRRPATKTDHGYKDCLIWESVLRLPSGSQVRLVSKDKGFFDGDAFHPELIAEARERGIAVVGYKEIDRVVEELINANPALDLATLEARDLADQAPEPVEEVVPPAPAPRAGKAADGDRPPAGDIGDVSRRLSEAQTRFDGLDLKVLAYIAYFDSASKDDLFGALADAGIASDVARNVADRLAMNRFVRDTGNHYVVTDRAIGEIVAPTVETEIIAWLEKKRRRDGK